MSAPSPRRPPLPDPSWAYFLDVDGTLVNLAARPEAVQVDGGLLGLIEGLFRANTGAVALVSGRMISDLEGLIGLPRLPLAGLHGLERRDSAGRLWIHAAPPAVKEAIKESLAPVMTRHVGLRLEDKGLTLALHYRQAPRLASYAHRLMTGFAQVQEHGLELQRGKCVVELKPSGIHKGTAVAEYMAEPPFLGRRPVFIGDDLSDEHGFAEVNDRSGVSIKVGGGATCARFRLPDVAAVHRWLGLALKGVS